MFATLRARLLFSYIAVISVTLCIVGTALLFILLNSPLPSRQAYQRLADIARASTPSLRRNPDQVDATLTEIAESAEIRTLRIDDAKRVLFDTHDPSLVGQTVNVITTQPDGQNANRGTYRDADGRLWLFMAYSLPPEYADLGMIVFATPRPRTAIFTYFGENMLTPLIQAALIGLIMAVILALVISNSVARPLRRTAAAAKAIATGDYGYRAPIEGTREVKELAQSFNEMAQTVQRTQQMQRDFLANVSHELKTPLTSIQGFSQAITDGAAQRPEAAAKVIYDEAARMHRLVEDLLDLARIESGQAPFRRERVDLPELICSVMQNLAMRAATGQITLMHSLNASPLIIGDNDRLAQVFTNLIDNAITHTGTGGEVRVSAARVDGGVEVAIRDTGKGIPPDELSRVFERFYQVDKSRARGGRKGTGLGLTICKEIIEAHGGRMRVSSTVGEGTTFAVWLPSARASDETMPRLSR